MPPRMIALATGRHYSVQVNKLYSMTLVAFVARVFLFYNQILTIKIATFLFFLDKTFTLLPNIFIYIKNVAPVVPKS